MQRVPTLIAALMLLASTGVHAGEAEVKAAWQKRYPEFPVRSVTKTPLPGIWEVYLGDHILYANDDASYVFDGTLIETSKRSNLTEARMNALSFVKFKDLPFDMAIKQVKGDGSRKMAVFTDPDCPYCRQIQKEIANVDNVTIYYFLFPIEGLHPNAPTMAKAIWCAPDRQQAWLDYMANQTKPAATTAACNSPVDRIIAYGRDKNINGTPTLFFEAGDKRIASALSVAQLEQFLQGSTPPPKP